jgi:hypothetical protein
VSQGVYLTRGARNKSPLAGIISLYNNLCNFVKETGLYLVSLRATINSM